MSFGVGLGVPDVIDEFVLRRIVIVHLMLILKKLHAKLEYTVIFSYETGFI